MATIKLNELQPTNLLETVSDAELKAVNGGADTFQLILGGTAATTGAAVGGTVTNSTSSIFTVNASLNSPNFSASFSGFANSFSRP